MSRVAFMLDENIPPSVGNAVLGLEPTVVFVQIGVDPDAPPKGTLDPDVLKFAETAGLAVVSFDKRTMRDDAYRHVADGRHTWGVFLFPNGNSLSAGVIANALVLVWATSEAEEWIDRVEFLPY